MNRADQWLGGQRDRLVTFKRDQMPQVVDRVSECGLNFEIYDDGDCVLTNSPAGFVQLSAALIARLALKTGGDGQRKTRASGLDPHRLEATCQTADPRATSQKSTETLAGLVPTRIHRLPEGPGWQCTFVDENNCHIHHVYESRSCARAALPTTPIGVAGRTA